MDKFWLKNYEPGVPYTINPDEYPSLVEMMEASFQQYSDRYCCSNFGQHLTFRQIDNLSQAFAGFLQNHCHLPKGERVAIVLPNLLQYPIAMLGILRAQMIVVNVNPLYTARELRHVLNDSGATCVVILANYVHVLQKILLQTSIKYIVVTEVGDLLGMKGKIINFSLKHLKKMVPQWNIPDAINFKSTISKKYNQAFRRPSVTGEDVAFIQYTGGTTGVMKGAILTHRNMVANVLQACGWIYPFYQEAIVKPNNTDGIINALPLYHIFSLTANCLLNLHWGINNILITNPRDIPSFVKELKRQPFIGIIGVNTLFNSLLNNPEFCNMNFSHLKFTFGGGMSVQRAVAQRWFDVTGIPIVEGYGLTEASPAVTICPFRQKQFTDNIGLPLPSTEVKICDEAGEELPFGQIGELTVRGPQVMRGYWNQPEWTKETLDKGWLHTGDMGVMDENGFIRLVDRKNDTINVSGFNVFPNEVEGVLAKMKEIREVGVIGVKSEKHGEIVKAFVVRKDPNLTKDEIIRYCQNELTAYKVPKEIEFREELPKSNIGKILRRSLREENEKESLER